MIILCILITFCPTASAEGEGRYQAISIMRSSRVFIIDTKEGHTWVSFPGQKRLIYHGQIKQGRYTGEVINKRKSASEFLGINEKSTDKSKPSDKWDKFLESKPTEDNKPSKK